MRTKRLLTATALLFASSFNLLATWSTQESGVDKPLWDVCFVDSVHGWMAAGGNDSGGRVLITGNGGQDWERIYTGADESLSAVAFVDSLTGWAGGMYEKSQNRYEALLLSSNDGGATWERKVEANLCAVPEEQFIRQVQDISLLDSARGFFLIMFTPDFPVGTCQMEVYSIDGTHIWENFAGGTWNQGKISFSDSLCGWCLNAYGGKLYHTTQGVENLSLIKEFSPVVRDMNFVDASIGWVVGDSGRVFHTEDAGSSWVDQVSNVTCGLYAVEFIDSLNGWIAGENGVILRTRDGGNTWSTENTPTSVCLRKVCFVDTSHGWAVGDSGVVLTYGGVGVEESNYQLAMSNGQLSILPNPFVHSTVIQYSVPVKTNISLEICDITGRVVETLVNGEKEPGKHEVRWDAKGAHSQDDCATGIYFAKLVVGDCGRETKKLISVR